MITQIIIFILTSIVIYLGIATVLITTGAPASDVHLHEDNTISFTEVIFDYSDLPELSQFTARDGTELDYRYYSSDSSQALILIHGSGWHSQYFLPLAQFLADKGIAKVFTPDLRGHGQSPQKRGDVSYIGQFEDDIYDLIRHIQKEYTCSKVSIGGHSSGGGLALRFAGSKYGSLAESYLFLAPFLKYNAPTMRKNAGGWARPYTRRIIGLTMLNNVGVHLFDYLPAISFNMPQVYRDGSGNTPILSQAEYCLCSFQLSERL